jgi:RNA polymerase sigma factor (sigma-70 family)
VSESSSSDAQRFTELWERHAARVHAYALRHAGPDRAQEIVAETFLVAWQRLADVPGHGLPWLLVVARNTIRHSDRSRYRDRLLTAELGRLIELTDKRANTEAVVAERDLLLRALGALPRQQREALLLVSWDGLSVTDAAQVAGCSTGTFKVRLHRARRRLQRQIDADAAEPEPEPISVTAIFASNSPTEETS